MEIEGLDEKASNMLILFLEQIGATDPASFQGVSLKDFPIFPIVEDLVQVNFILYDIDFVDGAMIRELARRNVRKPSNAVRLLRYNSHLCYVSNINIPFKAFR